VDDQCPFYVLAYYHGKIVGLRHVRFSKSKVNEAFEKLVMSLVFQKAGTISVGKVARLVKRERKRCDWNVPEVMLFGNTAFAYAFDALSLGKRLSLL